MGDKLKVTLPDSDGYFSEILYERAGAENLNKAISENLLPFKVREDIRMEQKNEKKSKKKSLTGI